MKKTVVNTGDVFNKLTIIKELPAKPSGRYFRCRCECGNIKDVMLYHLTRAKLKIMSCGCYRKQIHTKHGMWESREYSTWENMLQRCLNPKAKKYYLYGGRSIKVCDRWIKSFNDFYKDMGPRPPGTSLDRINPELGYYKENCRWATPREQLANLRRFTAKININGVNKEAEDWIKELKIDRVLFKTRVLRGLGFKEALLINTSIITLNTITKQQVIYSLDKFLREEEFDKNTIVELLDSDHIEPYHNLLIRYLTGFKGWPVEYDSN